MGKVYMIRQKCHEDNRISILGAGCSVGVFCPTALDPRLHGDDAAEAAFITLRHSRAGGSPVLPLLVGYLYSCCERRVGVPLAALPIDVVLGNLTCKAYRYAIRFHHDHRIPAQRS